MNMYDEKGMVNTPMYCHNCDKNFIARIDYDVDGQHVVECPHCGHEHCRVIKNGSITDDRWDGRNDNRIDIPKRRVWKHNDLLIQTSSASHFLREKWLNR